MEELVERTRGFQPWRKAFHAANGIIVATAVAAVDLPKTTIAGLLAVAAAALLVWDLLRLRHPGSNEFFFRTFSRLVSPREANGLASSTWYTIGLAITVAIAPIPVAVTAILVLGLADPAASYVGHTYGRRPFLGGTVEGTIVFVLVAGLIVSLRHDVVLALPVAACAALAERRSWPLDDNLTVPVVSAFAILAMQSVFGGL